jgi:hypothetical protein
MSRRLLPYEHQLIEALGISADDYLEFCQAQFDHSRLPEDKLLTPQADFGLVALIFTVVGTLTQVGAALLAPKPEAPSQKNQRTRREAVFAPRFGFNNTQELAKYGDPINLVYCNTNDNPTGGVRVATSLIWSAVHSEGSSQFMQTLLVLGASQIGRIAPARIAFGQTPIRQLAAGKTWIYLGADRPLQFSDLIRGDTTDRTRIGEADSAFVYRPTLVGDQHADGFSQAFSPSTMTRFGVYAPIPINVDYIDRDEDGEEKDAPLGVEIDGLSEYWPLNVLNDARPVVPVGQRMTLIFRQISSGGSDTARAAKELRRTLSSYIDAASTYKLGSAKFRVAAPIKNVELEDGAMRVAMECIEAGVCPAEDYNTTDFKKNGREAQREIIQLQGEVKALNDQLLRNEPILLPGIGRSLEDKLREIRDLKDTVEDLADRKWTVAELDELLRNGLEVDDRVKEFAARVDALREERKQLRDAIEDELDKVRDRRDRDQIRRWRERLAQVNGAIKRAQSKLSKAFEQYGLADGVIPGRNKTLKEEKKWLNNRERELSNEIADLTSKANNLDLAAMANRDNDLRASITSKQNRIDQLERYLENPNSWNDFFNTKCLVKMEEAGYETITECLVVDFALKARVFKRIQGRAPKYGEEKVARFRDSDNGTKVRAAFFWLRYRRTGQEWSRLPYIFAVRRGADVDNFMSLKFIADDNLGKWQFRFDPIAEPAAEMTQHGFADFAYIENSGDVQTIAGPAGGQFTFLGSIRARQGLKPPVNVNPYEVDEWGLFSMRSDTQTSFSFEGGPEFTITAVTEQRTEPFSTYPNLYSGLALLGFNAYSGQGIQDLRSLSVFTLEGKKLRRLRDDGTYPSTPDGSSSYAPDIFLDTILDTVDGIGQYAKVGGIDLLALAKAKRFCQANALFFDGVIADPSSWRQFWAEVAPYSLLELGRIGGKETLVPAVPCDNAGNITRTVPVSALFNTGNILEGSYKEEFIDYGSGAQDLIATVIYRDTEIDGVFPRNASVDVRLAGVADATAIRQTFDISQYVTNRSQAILYGKLLCQQRRHVRRTIEFSTFPTDTPLSPGAYIYVDLGLQEWQGIYSGQVEDAGALNVPLVDGIPNGTYNVLLYRSGSAVVTTTTSITNNTASELASYAGWLFVLGTAARSKRVFRVVEVQMDEEGEITVRATEHPCDTSGQSLIADFSDGLFTIR